LKEIKTKVKRRCLVAEKVCKCGVKKEAGYLYFVDKHGDVSRAAMVRGGKKKKAKKRK
tara:strand:+ start:321 stop:494 length:174 start_codon:yes stop_codon:yes gene_type:complete